MKDRTHWELLLALDKLKWKMLPLTGQQLPILKLKKIADDDKVFFVNVKSLDCGHPYLEALLTIPKLLQNGAVALAH